MILQVLKLFNKKYDLWILAFALSFIAIFYLAFFSEILKLGEYMPARSDQVYYFLEAKAFAEVSSCNYVTMDESFSKFFACGFHGPFYALMHGSIAKIFGVNGINYVFLNIFFIAAISLICWRRKDLDINQKLLILISALGYFVTFFFTFSHNQEVIQIFFAIATCFQLIDLYKDFDSEQEINWNKLGLYCASIFLFSQFRFGWALCNSVLIFLAKNIKDFIKLALLAFVLVVGEYYLSQVLAASYQYSEIAKLKDYILESGGSSFALIEFFLNNFIKNFNYFFISVYNSHYYYLSKVLFTVFTFYFLIDGYLKKDRLLLATGFCAFGNLFALLLLYNAYDYREIRGLAGVLIILFAIAIYKKIKPLYITVFIYILISFPTIFPEFRSLIHDNNVKSTKLYLGKQMKDFSNLSQLASAGKKQINVLIPEKIFWTLPPGSKPTLKNVLHTPILSLPTKNFEGVPMVYTHNHTDVRNPYKQWGRIDIDYVIFEDGKVLPNTQELKDKWLEKDEN